MNTGYECNNCQSRQVDAHLVKLGVSLQVVLRCRKCGANEDVNVSSFGFDLFNGNTVDHNGSTM